MERKLALELKKAEQGRQEEFRIQKETLQRAELERQARTGGDKTGKSRYKRDSTARNGY